MKNPKSEGSWIMLFSYRVLVLALFFVACVQAQTIHQKETFGALTRPELRADHLSPSQHLQEYVVDGKLRLRLQDAVLLMLANNSNVQLQELDIDSAKYGLLRSHQPFDPSLQASFSANRTTIPSFSPLQGAPIPSTLTQATQLTYSQTLETGTAFQGGFNATRISTNNSINSVNPYILSNLSFQVTQPLLRNGGLFANRANLVIARRSLRQSQATFEAGVSDAILGTVQQYWDVVQARGALEVQRKSLAQADATYKHDKRALELGALSPLDIYRSEAEVAARKLQVISGEYALKAAEDILRRTTGASLDASFRNMEFDLAENPQPEGEPRSADPAKTLERALAHRPELEAARQALANDETGVRLAHNHLRPDLSLTGSYSGNGLGGNQLDKTGKIVSRGGLGDSLDQAFGFGFPTYGATLQLNLPIKNRAAQADLGNVLVSRRRNLYTERQREEQITMDVSNAIHQLDQAKLTVEAAKSNVDLAGKSLNAEQRKYELGQQTLFFMLDAQTKLAQAELDLLQAEIRYQVSLATLDHATGSLLDPYHVKIAELGR